MERNNNGSTFSAQARQWEMCGIYLCLAVLLVGCQFGKQREKTPDFDPYRVIGYVGSRTDINRIDPTELTHINYAFAKLDENGELYFRKERSEQHLVQLNSLKNGNPDLKILLSVGGWGADHFSDAALTPASRQRMAQSIVQFVSDYALDGIDLDWEFPGQRGPGIKYREEDKQNFTLLLRTVREHLDAHGEKTGKYYLLTVATNGDQLYLDHTEMDKAHLYLDFVNVMTYDFFSSGSKTTGHHTGLYKSEFALSSGKDSENAVEIHLAAGIPADKIVLGVAFYGRGWTGVEPIDQGLFQTFERFTRAYAYKQLKEGYIEQYGFLRYWDESAMAPYLWNADSTTFISYEDPESLKHKADFVKENGLGGVMFWEFSLDDDGALLDTLVKVLREK